MCWVGHLAALMGPYSIVLGLHPGSLSATVIVMGWQMEAGLRRQLPSRVNPGLAAEVSLDGT